jgi:hypothetical protein
VQATALAKRTAVVQRARLHTSITPRGGHHLPQMYRDLPAT